MKQGNARAVGPAAKAAGGRRQSCIFESKKGCSTEVETLVLEQMITPQTLGSTRKGVGQSRTRNNLPDMATLV